MRYLIYISVSIYLSSTLSITAQTPHVSTGTIRHFDNFPSAYIGRRTVDVWLPDGYTSKKRYPVLYMFDGMSLFDSSIMWNRQTWGVADVLGDLLLKKKIRDCIVVGIWNGGASRHSEYFPQKPFESLPPRIQDSLYQVTRGGALLFSERIQSDNYLRFLVREVKPFIDSAFSTWHDSANTFVLGSSMGGLMAWYAICEYPDVFGGAACLSTHWPGVFTFNDNPIPAAFFNYLHTHLPAPGHHKIYFDFGTRTLDSVYQPLQERVDEEMKINGYHSDNWETRKFPGADHSERAWHERLAIPVIFLLGLQR